MSLVSVQNILLSELVHGYLPSKDQIGIISIFLNPDNPDSISISEC